MKRWSDRSEMLIQPTDKVPSINDMVKTLVILICERQASEPPASGVLLEAHVRCSFIFLHRCSRDGPSRRQRP